MKTVSRSLQIIKDRKAGIDSRPSDARMTRKKAATRDPRQTSLFDKGERDEVAEAAIFETVFQLTGVDVTGDAKSSGRRPGLPDLRHI